MTSSGITKASVEKALAHVNETNMESLVAFVQQVKKIVADDEGDNGGRVVFSSCSSLKTREVFELFSLSNKYTDFGSYRVYDIPEIKLCHSSHSQQRCRPTGLLKPSAHELLRSIATVWPQSNKSNVKVFVSLLIHFSVEQINSEMMDLNNAGSEEASSSYDRVSIPIPSPSSPKVAPVITPPPRKIQSPPLKSSSFLPVTLKAYTEALVSWETKDELDRKMLVHGFIDYGISSYAQTTPESLETFFAIAQTKAAGALSENSWAQLLCYMGIIQKTRKKAGESKTNIYGLLTDGHEYEFTRIDNQSKVSRSRRFSLATELNDIYQYMSHCLREIYRSSPTSCSSRPPPGYVIDDGEVARFEEIVQPKNIYEFEIVDMPKDDMVDM